MAHKSVLLLLILVLSCRRAEELPRLFAVPNASLVSEQGQTVNLDSFKGSVTVYNFIFTRCAGTCPLMTASMRRLTQRVDDAAPVRFVSISVDPGHDTPEVLSQYAGRVRNDERWTFLTGEREAIIRLSVEGFKLAAGTPTGDGAEPLLHSTRFAVADKTGMIRHYKGGTDGDAAEDVARVVEDLLEE